MGVKIVLQNTIAQLEEQKSRAYSEAKAIRISELTNDFEEYKKAEFAKYNEAATALKTAYDNAIASKQSDIEAQANIYADSRVRNIDSTIADLQKLIATAE